MKYNLTRMANFLGKVKSQGELHAFFLCFFKCKNPERIIACIFILFKVPFSPTI